MVVLEEQFIGSLDKGWTWPRENPQVWRIRRGALEIRVEPPMQSTGFGLMISAF